jgi:hypothetical protein
MNEKKFRINYRGSFFWLIFWTIIFFPIALALLFTDSSIDTSRNTYDYRYSGSRFWLCFWILIFFPIAILLLFLNGVSVTTTPRI